MNPFNYDTGFDRMDRILSAIAYIIAIAGLITLVMLFGSIVWVHWRVYG